jgi:hypothetical protein
MHALHLLLTGLLAKSINAVAAITDEPASLEKKGGGPRPLDTIETNVDCMPELGQSLVVATCMTQTQMDACEDPTSDNNCADSLYVLWTDPTTGLM